MAKSDDSKRADAAAAAEANQRAGTIDGGQILDQLQGKAAEQRAAGNPDGAAQIELALKMAAQAMALAERSQSSQEDRLRSLERRGYTTRRAIRKLLKCPICHQSLWDTDEKRGVCTGTHVQLMVAPTNHAMGRYWQGVVINGVRYIGRCQVPLALVDFIKSAGERWAAAHFKLQVGGGTVFGNVDFGSARSGGTPVIRANR